VLEQAVGRAFDHVEHELEAFLAAGIRIGDFLELHRRRVGEEHPNLRAPAGTGRCAQIFQVVPIHREHVVELVEVRCLDSPRAMRGQVVAAPASRLSRARICPLALMVRMSARGACFDHVREPRIFDHFAKHAFGRRRATDIPKTNEQHSHHSTSKAAPRNRHNLRQDRSGGSEHRTESQDSERQAGPLRRHDDRYSACCFVSTVDSLGTDAVVEVRGLVKRFGERTAVAGIDLEVARGEIFGLLGPNGAGKTTTMRAVYGVTRPTEGRIRVFGLDVATHGREVRARLGVTLQDNVLIEALSPVENLRVFCRYHLLSPSEAAKRTEALIEFLVLGSHRNVPVRNLSGGYQRRVAIALSLVSNPELLILDEPTTGLDPAVRRSLWDNVRVLRARGATVLLTTHYMDEAERLCDRVAVMAEGKVLAVGAPHDLVREHLAGEAVEIEGAEDEVTRLLDGFAERVIPVRSGRRTTLHVGDAAALAAHLRGHDDGNRRAFVARPSNLEDVFLHLTGGGLEGGA